jgi:hypothetical protein
MFRPPSSNSFRFDHALIETPFLGGNMVEKLFARRPFKNEGYSHQAMGLKWINETESGF